MLRTEKEVVLSVTHAGTQISRGSYAHFAKMDGDTLIQGVVVEKKPQFSEATESVRLGEQFVLGALTEPPKKLKISPKVWLSLPENKRIGIHVKTYVLDLYPDHRGYTYEIL
jgi:hypothetical protein